MSLAQALLEQETHLANSEPKRPRQASLRRAISVAYYALFHSLVSDGAMLLSPSNPAGLRQQAQRAFSHNDMVNVCKQFAQGDSGKLVPSTQKLIVPPIDPRLASVALTFVELQQARHLADYDTTKTFSRIEAIQKTGQIGRASSRE